MPKTKTPTLSHGEKLQIIERWAVRFAQSHVGGVITPPNDPFGDLRHTDGTYSEVKCAGDSAGAIIRRKQLRKHCTGPTRNYVLVFHANRVWKEGRYEYTTLRHRTREALEKHLLETVTEVCIVDKTGIEILYKKMLRRHREKTHIFKAGPKSYVKMRTTDFSNLVLWGFCRMMKLASVRFEGKTIRVGETRIPAKAA